MRQVLDAAIPGPTCNDIRLVNIYSHVIGTIIFLAMPIYTYQALYFRYPLATMADIIVFSTFFYGVSTCFFLSAT